MFWTLCESRNSRHLLIEKKVKLRGTATALLVLKQFL